MNFAPPLALQQTDPFSVVGRLLDSPFVKAALVAVALVGAALYLALVYWTYADASRRGASRLPWTLVAVLFPFVGPLVYLLCRPPEYVIDAREREVELQFMERVLVVEPGRCGRCKAGVGPDFLACPHCGHLLKEPCAQCKRPLEEGWRVCPYCASRRVAPAQGRPQAGPPKGGAARNGRTRERSEGPPGRRSG